MGIYYKKTYVDLRPLEFIVYRNTTGKFPWTVDFGNLQVNAVNFQNVGFIINGFQNDTGRRVIFKIVKK